MDPIKNPYAPGAGTPPPELAGRDELRETVRIALERVRAGRPTKSILMVGLRGVGKTVLLDRLRDDAEAAGIQTLRVEAPESRSLPAILAPQLRQALLRLSRNEQAKEFAQRALRGLAGFAKALKVKYQDIEVGLDFDPEPGLADNGDLEHDLQALLEVTGDAAKKAGTALVMFVDELQYVAEEELAAMITEFLDRVGIPNPDKRARQFPHEFSGGMRQRAMIALALVNDPKLLIADEPTTALDVTVQAQILDLVKDLQREFGSAVILITHDLGVVAETADDILVMYAGRAVETGLCADVLAKPKHPYTWALMKSIPSASDDVEVLYTVKGTPPSLVNLPSGCSFHPRCEVRENVGVACMTELPDLRGLGAGRQVRCHLENADQILEQEHGA